MKSFLKRKKHDQDMSLQITSMADIFMILLVFLLKSYSTSVSNVAPTGDTKLPIASDATGDIKDTLKLEIASNAILVDAQPVVKLKNLEFLPGELQANGQAAALSKSLLSQRKRMPNPNMDSSLLVMADEKTPYSTIGPVLASAALAGFVDLQLVVVKKE